MEQLRSWMFGISCLIGVAQLAMAHDPLLDHPPEANAGNGSEARGSATGSRPGDAGQRVVGAYCRTAVQ
ncbi:Uncharacterised protein [Pseudomonas fluorescens]|uniref:PH domain-containing protein n=1 Tax=Pseudomonas fluorescens TaxID=294 RepID=A0A8B4HYS6_PSEFL|nr:Uncharacterised protein [Pseudomonas fluorescens]